MKQTFESRIAKLFAMSDETWERHANPWSVWTRFSALPLVIVAVWSRVWIDSWSWALVALSVLWIWLNPRLFPKPKSTHNWASKAVLGERVWLNRNQIRVPKIHRIAPHLLSALSGTGLVFVIWGLWKLQVWPTIFGTTLIYSGKVWFLDRMVWLYEDMKESNPQYASWLYDSDENRSEQ